MFRVFLHVRELFHRPTAPSIKGIICRGACNDTGEESGDGRHRFCFDNTSRVNDISMEMSIRLGGLLALDLDTTQYNLVWVPSSL